MKEADEIELPKGWIKANVDEVLQIIRGISFPKDSKKFSAEEGYVACLRTANVQKEVEWNDLWFVPKTFVKNDSQLIAESDILISTANSLELLGKVALVKNIPYLSTLGAFISAIRVKPPLSSRCIYYILCSDLFKSEVRKRASTTTNISNISTGKLKQIGIPIPPLAEQYRIVAKIEELFSELDNGVAQLRQVQAQLTSYRQSVLKHAFEGKLTEAWRNANPQPTLAAELLTTIQQERQARYQQALKDWQQAVTQWTEARKPGKKPTKPKAPKELPPLTEEEIAKLPALPDRWGWIKLGNVSYGVEYGSSIKSLKEGKVPVLRMGNIQNGRFDWSDLVYANDHEEIEKYSLAKGDVLFNRTNSPELVGKTAIYLGEQPAIFAGYLIRINQVGRINPKYLAYFLNSYVAKDHGNDVKTDGVNQSNINGAKLSNYPLPLCSTEEQHQIVQEIESRLSVAEHLEKTVEESLRQAEMLRQSILQRAFSGQLIPQNPKDEPASELLQRIQQEKSGSKAPKPSASATSPTANQQLPITFS